MPKPLRVLIVDDVPDDCELILSELKRGGFGPIWHRVDSADQMAAALATERRWDLVLCDDTLPVFGARQALELLRRTEPDIPLIVVSATTRDELAVEMMRLGASDYISKHQLERLVPAVERESREATARRAQRSADQQQQLLLDSIPHVVWTALPDGRCDYINQQGSTRLGLPPEAFYGWGWIQVVHPDDVAASQRAWQSAVARGTPYRNEHRLRHPDGTYRWYFDQAVPLRGAHGRPKKWIGTWTDIDDRKQAEYERDRVLKELRASEERFRQIADSIQEAFWLTDAATGEIIYVSAAYEQIWGRSRDSLSASPHDWIEAIHPDDRSRVVEAALSRQSTGNFDEEYRVVRPDGTVRWIRDRTFPVHDAAGRVIRIAGVAEDITQRRTLEAQLQHSQKMEAIGQLAGGVAHDFNNLLTIITGYSNLLLDGMTPVDRNWEMVEEIRKAAERSASLTRQLLAFSRKQMVATTAFDLNDVVRNAEKMLNRLIGEDVELTTILQPQLKYVRADRSQLDQVILNLAVNARDAMPQGGRLTIETRNVELDDTDARACPSGANRAYVMVAVTDSGTGISDDVRRHIFEPFFTTKEPGKGTGLGLAVVHGFVKQSDGHIEVSSEQGVGTSFRIYLPAVEQPVPADPPVSDDADTPRGTETILLVEDEQAVRALTHRVLQSCGYSVIEAAKADDALQLCANRHGRIDLLVTDVVMPGIGGRVLAERLLQLHPEMKVLYLSGYTDDAVIRHGISEEHVNFLQKPFSPVVFAQKVRSVLMQ